MGAAAVRDLILVSALVAAVTACASPKPTAARIRVGMTRAEVVAALGNPVETRTEADRSGRPEEIWLYDLAPEVDTARDVTVGVLTSGVGFFDDPTKGHRHQFVFVDDRLVRWGKTK